MVSKSAFDKNLSNIPEVYRIESLYLWVGYDRVKLHFFIKLL